MGKPKGPSLQTPFGEEIFISSVKTEGSPRRGFCCSNTAGGREKRARAEAAHDVPTAFTLCKAPGAWEDGDSRHTEHSALQSALSFRDKEEPPLPW